MINFKGKRVSGIIKSFDPTSMWGIVELPSSFEQRQFHGTSYNYRSKRPPVKDDLVEVVITNDSVVEVKEIWPRR